MYTQKCKSKAHIPKKVHLTEQARFVFQYATLPKLKDPGAPIISCVIGGLTIKKVFLDLGMSVNLLPSSIYELFNFEELKPIPVTLQLADRSVKVPLGKVEDVLVKVNEFYFSIDFLILEIESESDPNQISIILDRSFPAIANACINCRMGAMNVSFGNRKLRLNVFNAIMGSQSDEFSEVNILKGLVEEATPTTPSYDLLEAYLAHFNRDNFDIDGYMAEVNALLEPSIFDPP